MSTTSASHKLQDDLSRHIEGLVNNFTAILEASTPQSNGRPPNATDEETRQSEDTKPIPKDKYKLAQEHQALENSAANMVRAAESLLTLTSELKQALLLNDFKTLNSTIRNRSLTLRYQEEKSMDTLLEFQKELQVVTRQMEDALGSVRV
ncbi:hypothetical protein HDV00_008163 [Rhizophlyctis rosea]|nr:hypothetical protein HDV00_008163 [Rhizophlyctis rosea]